MAELLFFPERSAPTLDEELHDRERAERLDELAELYRYARDDHRHEFIAPIAEADIDIE